MSPKLIILILLLVHCTMASRRLSRSKTASSRTSKANHRKDNLAQSMADASNNELNVGKRMEFNRIEFHSQQYKNILFNWFLYILVGGVVVAISRFFIQKLHEQEIDELCMNGRIRNRQRELERKELNDLVTGVSSLRKPEDIYSRMKHKNRKL